MAPSPQDRARNILARCHSLRDRSSLLRVSAQALMQLHGDERGVIKTCSCGLRYKLLSWQALPLLGMMAFDAIRCELRSCPCGSSLLLPFSDA